MNVGFGAIWRRVVRYAPVLLGLIVVLIAFDRTRLFSRLGPLQSPIQTTSPLPTPPVATPTSPLIPTQPPPPTGPPPVAPTTATPLFVPTIERTPVFLPTPFGTPDTQGTSQAVIATLTAQAAPPTFQPAATRRPVGAGPDQPVPAQRTPTPPPDPSGITLLALSERVYAGGAVALTIRTRPEVVCTLQVARGVGDSSAPVESVPGGSRRSGKDGVVAWIWAVDGRATPGRVTLIVNCDSVGTMQYQIEVLQ